MSAAPQVRTALLENLKERHLPAGISNCRPSKQRPAKQRHTAKRIFDRLREEHGFSGGYTIVKDYVRGAGRGHGVDSSCHRDAQNLKSGIQQGTARSRL